MDKRFERGVYDKIKPSEIQDTLCGLEDWIIESESRLATICESGSKHSDEYDELRARVGVAQCSHYNLSLCLNKTGFFVHIARKALEKLKGFVL